VNTEMAARCSACGGHLAVAGGRYVLQEVVGNGAKKLVYRAVDARLGREVALAILHTPRGGDLEALRVEAQAMAALGDHPHIVPVYDVGDEDGEPYVVSQFMAAGSVEQALAAAEGRRLPLARALDIADQVCQALEYAHGRGLVQCDLKPANIWLARDGTAKLGDLGLARRLDHARLAERTIVGSVAYLAPEQALGEPLDARTDLYALGVLLYELVTGRLPFDGDDVGTVIHQHLHAAPVPPSAHRPELPPALDALVLHLLAKRPAERPADAAAVRDALAALTTRDATAVRRSDAAADTVARDEGLRNDQLVTVVERRCRALFPRQRVSLTLFRQGEALASGVSAAAVSAGCCIRVTDVRADARFDPKVDGAAADVRSMLCAPLLAGDRALGVLRVLDRRTGTFRPEHAERLEPIARAAAQVLARARCYDHLRSTTELRRSEVLA
jgi:Protein kinase domain/GAF domain